MHIVQSEFEKLYNWASDNSRGVCEDDPYWTGFLDALDAIALDFKEGL